MENKRYISANVNQLLLESLSAGSPLCKIPNKYRLTARETEISNLLMEGKWTNEISVILGLKPSTVSTFKSRIFEKLEVKNAVELFKKIGES